MRSTRKYILLPRRPLPLEAATLNPTRVEPCASESHKEACSWAGECTRRKVPVPQVHVTPLPRFCRLRPCISASVQGKDGLLRSPDSFRDFLGLSAPRT
jgi:hypothetical protein